MKRLALFSAALALAGLGSGPEMALPDLLPVPTSSGPSKGGKREHSKRHTGQRKIQRDAAKLRNKKRRNQR